MHSIARQLDKLLGQLDSETASQLEQTIRDAVAHATQRAVSRQDTDDLGYPVDYFETTAGSFAGEALDRPPNLPFESRESW